jgi:hypothetical protein
MWEGLQHAGWVETLASSRPLFGLVSVVHYSATFFCVGTILLLDLRILGVARRHLALSACAKQLRPWIWIGFLLVAVSGFLLFAIEAGDYAAARAFRAKVLVTVLAVVSAFVVERSLPGWEQAPVMPVAARLVAVVSLVLWLGAILVSVEIPALTGLG